MEPLLSFWSGLDARRRILAGLVAGALVLGLVALARVSATPGMALLYAGLDPAAAGEVVRALEARGAVHEVRGESIFVAARDRDALRMTLAGDGLPAMGASGYELLDQLSGFGTTSQMFDAAYLRAKEGELARTITASPAVRAARVHIAVPPAQGFRRTGRATASVTVTTAQGMVSAPQARALRHLVAASVANLAPEDVAVIDTVGGLVPVADDGGNPAAAGDDRAADLRRNVERLLAARVGAGRALVEVNVDLVTERETIRERRVDPESRVAVGTETEERSTSANGSGAGVTVASNLPEGDAGRGGEQRSNSTETREKVNYDVTAVERDLERMPGAVRRLSVAVLVDGLRAPDGTWSARSDAELADLRDLVSSAVGFNAERGDVITLKTLQFERPPEGGTLVEASAFAGLDLMALIQLSVIAVVVLILGLFVLRPILAPGRQARDARTAAPLALPGMAVGAPTLASPPAALTGVIDDDAPPRTLSTVRQPAQNHVEEGDPVERLRRLIAERQAESVEILRSWMEDRAGQP